MPKKKATHGGARDGSGKKPTIMGKRTTKSHVFDEQVTAFLDSLDKESVFINGLIRKSREFKQWQQAKGK